MPIDGINFDNANFAYRNAEQGQAATATVAMLNNPNEYVPCSPCQQQQYRKNFMDNCDKSTRKQMHLNWGSRYLCLLRTMAIKNSRESLLQHYNQKKKSNLNLKHSTKWAAYTDNCNHWKQIWICLMQWTRRNTLESCSWLKMDGQLLSSHDLWAWLGEMKKFHAHQSLRCFLVTFSV